MDAVEVHHRGSVIISSRIGSRYVSRCTSQRGSVTWLHCGGGNLQLHIILLSMSLRSNQLIALAAAVAAATIAAVGIGVALAPSRQASSGTSSLNSVSVDDDLHIDPSDVPSFTPSFHPTFVPSPAPSVQPTNLPSAIPSMWPTTTPPAPSDAPSSSPTRQPIDPNFYFRLRMHWELEYMWQEETTERQWCLACVRCDPISTTEFGPQDGCVDDEPDVADCYVNDQLWLNNCGDNVGNAEFRIVPGADVGLGDQLQVKDTDLCVELTGTRLMVLGICNATDTAQKWTGFDLTAPFDWSPSGRDEQCVTQHHHPKAYEVIYAETCYLAWLYNTALWEAI
ncbi:hypothetical protein MPSEU_000036300 [Mayamaea pseudoterrestris]|nr:hypothetical protein MPSEU_000036300 [Mayamaea pseudoterrestris]